MTSGLLAAMLIIGLVVSALAGPRVLRSAAPLLMRVPRLAAGLLARRRRGGLGADTSRGGAGARMGTFGAGGASNPCSPGV